MVVQPHAYDAQRNTHSPDAALAALAGRQHGVVSRAQLAQLGLSRNAIRRRVERKRLARLYDNVFAVGHTALTPDSRRLAAVLACGPQALLSHRSAATLWGLLPYSPQFEVTIPYPRKPRPGLLLHRSRAIHPEDRATLRAIPVTSPARTLVDLAEVLDERRLASAVHEAEVRRVFDLDALERTLARLPGRRGTPRLERVLAAYRPDPRFTRSAAERHFAALCERQRLPNPQTNLWIGGCEIDAYWPDARLAVEIDGRTHRTRRAFQEDRRRDRHLATLGVQVVRVTAIDLEDEGRLADQLREIRQGRRRALSR